MTDKNGIPLSIIVIGASGDLAQKKILPALFALHAQGLIPEPYRIFGFARTPMTHAEFRLKTAEHLTCRYVPHSSCHERMDEFLGRCYYQAGRYDSPDGFLDLYSLMTEQERQPFANRLYYMAIPPAVFLDVAHALGNAGLVSCGAEPGWSRLVIEKPFGHDRASSDTLVAEMTRVFQEEQTFRIDHYLGKEVVQNLMVLRFANLIFEPLWNRLFIDHVQINWAEEQGIEGRGGYFDRYGIIRDVMQNHLLQIMALFAMEEPAAMNAHAIRDEKVRLLRSVAPLTRADLVIGQYDAGSWKGLGYKGYRQEAQVPPDSRTPTFALARLQVRNRRWEGVPFLIRAGKAMGIRQNEVRVSFREIPRNMFAGTTGTSALPAPNELVVRIQPDEGVVLKIVNKVPGLGMQLASTELNLNYAATFSGVIPDAYETLLLDVLRGDRSLFIRADELAAAWDIFTPVLHEIEHTPVEPDLYPVGSPGPASAASFAARFGIS